jgi:2-polyprenyl-3-methyl-5-hydroxy-6-metoxy-1,4-benzoquinol methylase
MTRSFKETRNRLGFYESSPKPSVNELAQHYIENYYQNAQGSYAQQYTPDELRYFRNIARVAHAISTKLGLEATLLDLGCGEGFFSKAFHDFGWKVSCCDFSEFGIKRHNADLLPFFSSGDVYKSIEKYKAKNNVFGMINLQNVMEHVIDPVGLITDIKPLLGKNSALRIRVPNDYSDFQLALVEKGYTTNTWFSPPDHLSYFNKKALINVLEHCGYKLLCVQTDFPIEIFLANPHSNYWKDRKLGKGAHMARVFCENHLIEKNINDYIEFSEAAAKLCFGREIIGYAMASSIP